MLTKILVISTEISLEFHQNLGDFMIEKMVDLARSKGFQIVTLKTLVENKSLQ